MLLSDGEVKQIKLSHPKAKDFKFAYARQDNLSLTSVPTRGRDYDPAIRHR
jgi:hypothetical protein